MLPQRAMMSVLGCALMSLGSNPPAAGEDAAACAELEEYRLLDFWVGAWQVYSEDRVVGANRIEKVLAGCAVLEHWQSAAGNEGKSLFYLDPGERIWKQVWVTANATQPGGTKEKRHVGSLEDGSVRFQGQIPRPSGARYLDRTTLTPLEGGKIRQHIESSLDGGENWQTTFDALYVPEAWGP